MPKILETMEEHSNLTLVTEQVRNRPTATDGRGRLLTSDIPFKNLSLTHLVSALGSC